MDSLLYASCKRVSCHFSAHSWGLEIFLQFILYLSVLLSRAEHHVYIDYFTKHSLLEMMTGRRIGRRHKVCRSTKIYNSLYLHIQCCVISSMNAKLEARTASFTTSFPSLSLFPTYDKVFFSLRFVF